LTYKSNGGHYWASEILLRKDVDFENQPTDAAYRWRIETTVILKNGYIIFD